MQRLFKTLGLGLLLLGQVAQADCLRRDIFGQCLDRLRMPSSSLDLTLSGKKLSEDSNLALPHTPPAVAPRVPFPIILGYGLPENRLVKRP